MRAFAPGSDNRSRAVSAQSTVPYRGTVPNSACQSRWSQCGCVENPATTDWPISRRSFAMPASSSPRIPGSTSNTPSRPCTATALLCMNELSCTSTPSAICLNTEVPPNRLEPLVDDRLRLLPEELLDVVEAAARLARRGRALPAAKGLDAGPGARGRAGSAVHVDDASLDRVEEALLLGLVLRVKARGQAEHGVVRERERLVDRVDALDHREGHEQLIPQPRVAGRKVGGDRRCHEEAAVEPVLGDSLAADEQPPIGACLAHGLDVATDRAVVDHGAEPVLALGRIADRDLLGLLNEQSL